MRNYQRSCRNCGDIITISLENDGRVVQCTRCGHFMKCINTRLCNCVSDVEIQDFKTGTYSPDNYKAGAC